MCERGSYKERRPKTSNKHYTREIVVKKCAQETCTKVWQKGFCKERPPQKYTNPCVQQTPLDIVCYTFLGLFFVRISLAHYSVHVLCAFFLCNNLACTLFGAGFSSSFFHTTSYQLLMACFLGVLLCNNLSYTRFFFYTLRASFFATTSLVHFGARFFGLFIYNTLSCILLVAHFWASFFATFLLHTVWCMFLGFFGVMYFQYAYTYICVCFSVSVSV